MRSPCVRIAAGLVVLAAVASPAAGQQPRMVAGLVGGYSVTEHDWSPNSDVSSVGGLTVGGFVDVQTPLPWLTVGVELAYVQRGSDVVLDVGGTPTPGGVRTDYLAFAIRVRAVLGLGPARFHLVAGPTSDFVIRSRLDPLLVQVLDEESPAPFGVVAGAGIGFWVRPDVVVEVEGRLAEGLQSSYAGDLVSARNRSRQLVLRLGMLVGQ